MRNFDMFKYISHFIFDMVVIEKRVCDRFSAGLIRRLSDSQAAEFLNTFVPQVPKTEYPVLEKIMFQILYDRELCKQFGIDYIYPVKHFNKARLASFFAYRTALNQLGLKKEELKLNRLPIMLVEEKNGEIKPVVNSLYRQAA